MATTTKLKMKLDEPKKNSMLFRPAKGEREPAVTGLYLMKHTHVELGSPLEIVLTIEAVE